MSVGLPRYHGLTTRPTTHSLAVDVVLAAVPVARSKAAELCEMSSSMTAMRASQAVRTKKANARTAFVSVEA